MFGRILMLCGTGNHAAAIVITAFQALLRRTGPMPWLTPIRLAQLIEKGLPVSIQEVAHSLQSHESTLEYTLDKIAYMPEVEHADLSDDPELRNMIEIAPQYVHELIHAVLVDDISNDQFAHAVESTRQMKMALLKKPPEKETP